MKKILGTHNSNTYLKPRKWWMRLINFTSKCQKLTITEQLEHGVRYFDFRINYDENKRMIINCHGLVEYKSSVNAMVEDIIDFCARTEEHVHIRFVYDDTFIKRTYDNMIYDLVKFSLYFFILDENISWELIIKSNWQKIAENGETPPFEIVDCFRNYRGYKRIPWPQHWIKKHKNEIQQKINSSVDKDTVFLCDRVDLFKL